MFTKIKNRMALKITLIVVISVSVISIISIFYFYRSNSAILHKNLQNTVVNTVKFLKLGYLNPLWNVDLMAVGKLNEAILNNEVFVAINIYDEGEFVSGLKKEKGTAQPLVTLDEPYAIQEGNNEEKLVSGDLIFNDEKIGRFEIFYTEKYLNDLIRDANIRMGLAFIVIGLFIILIISIGIRHFAINPVLYLAQISKKIAESNNYSIRVRKSSDDEIGYLYDGFNNMLEQIHARSLERDNFENELQYSKKLLSNVIDSMTSLLLSVDRDFNISQWNETAENITYIKSEEAIGTNLWKTMPALEKYKEDCINVLDSGMPHLFHRQRIKQWPNSFYNVSIYPLVDEKVGGMVIRIDDITELEVKENELRQAQKMETIGTLAGGLAHDFNNVLGGITGTLSIIRHKLQNNREMKPEKLESYVQLMLNNSMRAADMVQQLLSLTRKQELSLTPVNLNTTMKNVMEICKNSFDKSIALDFVLGEDDYIVSADPTQIEQVLLNLCINANHAMTIMRDAGEKSGGQLTVEIEKIKADKHFGNAHPESQEDMDYWKLSVRDTGIGMDTTTAVKIFDPFFSTKEKGTGSGLGLTMVYNIVKQHKGFIDVYSEKGLGTTFNVFLPVLQKKEMIDAGSEHFKIPEGEGLILVIDDEQPMREVAAEILEECGYTVLLAEDGEEGIEIYRENNGEILLIVLDMVMPNKSGKEAYLEMKEINPDLKVLLASGFKQDERVEAVLKLGVQGFIQKPYTLERLATAVNDLIKTV